jgi:hypothetical protein
MREGIEKILAMFCLLPSIGIGIPAPRFLEIVQAPMSRDHALTLTIFEDGQSKKFKTINCHHIASHLTSVSLPSLWFRRRSPCLLSHKRFFAHPARP